MNATTDRPILGPMRFGKLRIAWAVVCGILCLLLILLWLRSYAIRDTVWLLTTNRGIELNSELGHVVIISTTPKEFGGTTPFKTFHETINPKRTHSFKNNVLGFLYKCQPNLKRIDVPYYFIVLTCVSLSAWSQRKGFKFSLRTLLIGMTVVAAILGLILWPVK
jgi:hypothetical protein